jgi:Na+(H+)/acetate symporter ActP
MQLFILFIGAMLYVFYIFQPQPVFFDKMETEKVMASPFASAFESVQNEFNQVREEKQKTANAMLSAMRSNDQTSADRHANELKSHNKRADELRAEAKSILKSSDKEANTNDTNYIFLRFVTDYLPAGVIGLLIAVIFAASMSSTSSELNALASTSIVDIYKRVLVTDKSETHYLVASKWTTVIWGIYAICVAQFANEMGSLIEAVNVLGSLFYGTILGIFLSGFYFKRIKGHGVFIGAIIAQLVVVSCYLYTDISYLWYNLVGCILVIGTGYIITALLNQKSQA